MDAFQALDHTVATQTWKLANHLGHVHVISRQLANDLREVRNCRAQGAYLEMRSTPRMKLLGVFNKMTVVRKMALTAWNVIKLRLRIKMILYRRLGQQIEIRVACFSQKKKKSYMDDISKVHRYSQMSCPPFCGSCRETRVSLKSQVSRFDEATLGGQTELAVLEIETDTNPTDTIYRSGLWALGLWLCTPLNVCT